MYMNTFTLPELTGFDTTEDHNKFIKINLDKKAEYVIYFPHNNIKNVIKSAIRFNRESICDKSVTYTKQHHKSMR